MIFLIYPLHLTASVLIQGVIILGLMLLEWSSVSIFPLKHLTADCTLGVGETVVSKTDMVPAFSDGYAVAWRAQRALERGAGHLAQLEGLGRLPSGGSV